MIAARKWYGSFISSVMGGGSVRIAVANYRPAKRQPKVSIMKKRQGPPQIPKRSLKKYDTKKGAEHDRIVREALAPHRRRNEDPGNDKH